MKMGFENLRRTGLFSSKALKILCLFTVLFYVGLSGWKSTSNFAASVRQEKTPPENTDDLKQETTSQQEQPVVSEDDLNLDDTERQREQRAAVERERKARAGTTKSLTEKLAELEKDPSKRLDLTFDDLIFKMEKGEPFRPSMLTKEINQIHKKKVSLSGYIRPSARQKGITKFVFVRDNKECCFGPGAALYDCVLVRLAEGQEAEYTVRPITIEGDFYMKEFKGPNGTVWAIYRMKNGHVR